MTDSADKHSINVSAGHVPVLREEVIAALVGNPDGMYVDGTLGGGGHSAALLARGCTAVLGLDRDADALAAARARFAGEARFSAQHADYREYPARLSGRRPQGVLLDLGLSSRQLDDPRRGFAFRLDGPLDMRFDRGRGQTAAQLLDNLDAGTLAGILREFGELRQAGPLARKIIAARPYATTGALAAVVRAATPPGPTREKDLARVFQALRIAVNDELTGLDTALRAWFDALAVGGRLAVIAYHSLEDRTVKTVFRELGRGCICPPDLPACGCGRKPRARELTHRPVTAGDEELANNPRARSARLRVVEKITE
ncbi:MAG TPA: 16S rRNA (cytosine(1402)-N(4))-methyltransferase RsmH [bacterium]|nr:16S rRNA (cytosine(1402)-N(4))-methyltransferase RsmH [bacterium]